MDSITSELMGAGDAAVYAGVTTHRLGQLAEEGKLRRWKIGRNYAYAKSDLDEFLKQPRPTRGRPRTGPKKPKLERQGPALALARHQTSNRAAQDMSKRNCTL